MRTALSLSLAAVLGVAALPSHAAEEFEGIYFGIHGGSARQSDDGRERIDGDTNLDGSFNDPINAVGVPHYFSGGYCGGRANDGYLAAGCAGDFDDDAGDTGGRIGYDWQSYDLVIGVLLEQSSGGATDSVSAFGSDLTTYTMRRELGSVTAIRGRIGFTFGDGTNLLYGTIGYARADVERSFSTTNTVNTFAGNGDSTASGMQFGFGVETKLAEHFSIGLEYLATSLNDDRYIVRAAGGPAGNPFIADTPEGTDLRRSSDDIDTGSVRLTFNVRF